MSSTQILLEHHILHGLSMEWELAAGGLHNEFKLFPPFFALHNSHKTLGFWDKKKRLISLSRSFVLNHSWDDVKEVLLHEMAHQLAHEKMGGHRETAHGPIFRLACKQLGANPKASGHYKSLSERLDHSPKNQKDSILLKVQKLLALGKSTNEHEAKSALIKAQQLIRKHALDDLERQTKKDYISVYVGRPALRQFREAYALASLMTDHYLVHGIWVPAYVLGKQKMGRVLELSGTTRNVKTALYVHTFISRFINTSWEQFNQKKLGRARKTDYACGVISGFKEQLEKKEVSKTPGKTTAITRIEDPGLTAYAADRYPRVKTFKRYAHSVDESILKEGEAQGRKLRLSTAIETEASSPKTIGYRPAHQNTTKRE